MRSRVRLLLATIAGSTALLFTGESRAEEALDEASFVERVLSQSLEAQVAESEAALARAAETGAGLWPNPAIGWTRESRVTTAETGRQDVVAASIPLVLSGRLGLESAAAEQSARAAEARVERAQAELRHRAVRAFASVLAARKRTGTLEASLAELDDLFKVVKERERVGAAAGYDQLRIGVERASVANELRAAITFEKTAVAEALRLLGPTAEVPAFTGSITNDRPLPEKASLLAQIETARADLRALALEAESRESARRAAARGWVPEPTVNGGAHFTDTPDGLGVGYVVGVSIPLPLFDRRQGEEAIAIASAGRSRARRALVLHTAQVRLAAAFDEAVSRREQLAKHRTEVLARTEELQKIARAAYSGGASALLVLVDAERAARDARVLDLELSLRVVEAESDLFLLAGAYDVSSPRSNSP